MKMGRRARAIPKMKGIIWSPNTLYWACTIICMPKMNIMMPLTCVLIRRVSVRDGSDRVAIRVAWT